MATISFKYAPDRIDMEVMNKDMNCAAMEVCREISSNSKEVFYDVNKDILTGKGPGERQIVVNIRDIDRTGLVSIEITDHKHEEEITRDLIEIMGKYKFVLLE